MFVKQELPKRSKGTKSPSLEMSRFLRQGLHVAVSFLTAQAKAEPVGRVVCTDNRDCTPVCRDSPSVGADYEGELMA